MDLEDVEEFCEDGDIAKSSMSTKSTKSTKSGAIPPQIHKITQNNNKILDIQKSSLITGFHMSGRSAVRLAHWFWEPGVGGSNPLAPTTFFYRVKVIDMGV